MELPFGRTEVIQKAIDHLSEAEERERGAIFTKKEIVEFILDIAGYTTDKNLTQARLLEPSFGAGDFLLIALKRLLESHRAHEGAAVKVDALQDTIRAVEIHKGTYAKVKKQVITLLTGHGVSPRSAERLSDKWLINDDFLLAELPSGFTHVVGNPPYLRQELIPGPLLDVYKKTFTTIYDRADLYVPFIEKSLYLLSPDGVLSFICSNRWLKNRYGGPLRKLISERFHLDYYVNMEGMAAFKSEVTAYASVFVLSTKKKYVTRVAYQPEINDISLKKLAGAMIGDGSAKDSRITDVNNGFKGSEPLILHNNDEISLLRYLEREFPLIEKAGCRVGIGVATGCDRVFVGKMDELPVEEERKLPLVTAPDIRSGKIAWTGKGVINPFEDDGKIVDLQAYPRLSHYFHNMSHLLTRRHVAGEHPKQWYRTIDKINKPLTYRPKLLLPDIKGYSNAVYDEGRFYPHHNLYYVVSDEWDLRALQTVLRSSIANFFVAMYSVRMRGGYVRFQAQNIRRIRIPLWNTVQKEVRERLAARSEAEADIDCENAIYDLYNLSSGQRDVLAKFIELHMSAAQE